LMITTHVLGKQSKLILNYFFINWDDEMHFKVTFGNLNLMIFFDNTW
jgi:hypothetical protein